MIPPTWTSKCGTVRLWFGDNIELMRTMSEKAVQAVIADPPYGIDYGRAGGFCASHGWGQWRENVKWDAHRPPKEAFDLMLKVSEQQIIWGGNYFTDYLPPTMQWLMWDKCQRDFSLADFEIAWSSNWNASRVFPYSRGAANQEEKHHPTQKPVALMEWCLKFVKPGLVLDPYMGSGSTGIACIRAGRPFMGFENDAAYWDKTVQRFEAELARFPLFEKGEACDQQQELFSLTD